MALPLLVSLVVALVATGHNLFPWGDHAVVELETGKAGHGDQLLGTYSRYAWQHPGPALFYLLVPLYWLTGHASAGMNAGAALLSVIWVVTIVLVVARVAGLQAALWAALLVAIYLGVLGPRTTRDFWIPHTIMVSFAAYLVVCAAFASGRIAFLPFAVAIASFLAETDLSVAPTTAAVLVASLVVFALAAWRWDAPLTARGGRVLRFWPYAAAVAVAAVIWYPPIHEELTHHPGNITTIREFFKQPDPGHSFGEGRAAVANAVSAIPLGISKAAVAAPASAGRKAVALLELALLIAAFVVAFIRRRSFAFAASALALVAIAAETYAATHVRGELFGYLFDWFSALSVAGWLAIGLALAPEAAPLLGRRVDPARLAGGISICLAAVAGAFVIANLVRTVNADSLSGDPAYSNASVRPIDRQVTAWLARHGYRKPAVVLTDNSQWPFAATFVLDRYKHSRPVTVDPRYAFIFGHDLAVQGNEDVALYFVPSAFQLQPDPRRRLVAKADQTTVYAIPAAAS